MGFVYIHISSFLGVCDFFPFVLVVPKLCVFLRVCAAYPECLLLFLMNPMCSLCLIPSNCSLTCVDLLQFLLFRSQMPPSSCSVTGCFSCNACLALLLVLKALLALCLLMCWCWLSLVACVRESGPFFLLCPVGFRVVSDVYHCFCFCLNFVV